MASPESRSIERFFDPTAVDADDAFPSHFCAIFPPMPEEILGITVGHSPDQFSNPQGNGYGKLLLSFVALCCTHADQSGESLPDTQHRRLTYLTTALAGGVPVP